MIVDGREKATITRSLSSALSAVLCVPTRFVLAVTPRAVLGDDPRERDVTAKGRWLAASSVESAA